MSDLSHLLANNRQWSRQIREADPDFFNKLSRQQSPEYLWIGCSDSRAPATHLVGLAPGELFVHRNVANVVVHTDLNCLSVLQFAIDALRVKHVIVCGHYGCGGVQAALVNSKLGLIDNWLRHVQNVAQKHAAILEGAGTDLTARVRRLCELNVIEQVSNVCRTTIVEQAWERGQPLVVHGWIYGLEDGVIRDLNVSVAGPQELKAGCHAALSAIAATR